MKISIVSAYPTEGAGSGTLITAQAKSYTSLGHEVHIVTANNSNNFAKLAGVQYHLVPFTAEREPIEKLEGALPFNFVMFTTHPSSSENFWQISLSQLISYCKKFKEILEKHIKEVNADIYHAQHCWISTAILSEFHVPVVTTIHGTDLMGYEKSQEICQATEKRIFELQKIQAELGVSERGSGDSKHAACIDTVELCEIKREIGDLFAEKAKYEFYMAAAERAARNSLKIFVISRQQELKFKKLFPFAAEKVILVRNGCDTSIYYKETAEEILTSNVLDSLSSNVTTDGKIGKDYDKLALFVGKFAQFKRVDLVLDAAKIYEEEMKKKGKKVLTLIVGSGVLDEELKAQQASLRLENTHFVGAQPPKIVRALQNIADCFLAPSDMEPDGLVYKECMLCGNIAIGTNGGGVPDTLNPNNLELSPLFNSVNVFPTPYGVLIPMNSAAALADAAIYVMENFEKFDKNSIIKYARDNFDQNKISSDIIIPNFAHIVESFKLQKLVEPE